MDDSTITVTGLQRCSALRYNAVLKAVFFFYFAWPFSVDVQHQSRPRASLCGARARVFLRARARACVFGPDEMSIIIPEPYTRH